MVYIESDSTDPYENLALEEYVFQQLDRSKAYFMLWQNDKSIIVGKFQNTAEEVNQSVVEQKGIRVARRLSGGGAVYHDLGNLNYTFITDADDTDDYSFRIFARPMIRTLEGFGIHAEFTGRNDITIDGKKISGSSQYGRGNRVLHHGCIMLDTDLSAVAEALQVKAAKFTGKRIESVRSRVTTINACAKEPVGMEQFKEALRKNVFQVGRITKRELTQEDRAMVKKLRDEKYVTWEWNYGRSPAYEMQREARFSGGVVSVHLNVEEGIIKELKIYGDFFGDGEISVLEKGLIGLRLDEELAHHMERLEIGKYMKGVEARELAELLR